MFLFSLATENADLPPHFFPMVEKQNGSSYTLEDWAKMVVLNPLFNIYGHFGLKKMKQSHMK